MRWIIASNRLPFSWDAQKQRLEPSAGGLVTAISGITSPVEMVWFGAAPEGLSEEQWKAAYNDTAGRSCRPVFIPPETYETYYNGMCNNVLWPLLHYESELVNFNQKVWNAYNEVNHAIARAIEREVRDDDLVWIQDFHLFLVPSFLRDRRPKLKIGLFLHTPFPSSEIFRQLPARAQVLSGMLCADLLGFHDYGYLRHFLDSGRYVLGIESSGMVIEYEARTVELGVFPVGIDTDHFRKQAQSESTRALVRRMRKRKDYDYLILGVDRLDYIKGIDLKLKAFQRMLTLYPEMQGKAVLMQLAVPSRTDIPGYVELKRTVDQLVGAINGAFGKPDYTPVQYFFSSTPFHDLLALYQLADVLLVTSKRDGMNLVALEYLAVQNQSDPGVVVLSEFTGAMSALSHAVLTNPWDIDGTAANLFRALSMDRSERIARHKIMAEFLSRHTASTWAEGFMSALARTGPKPRQDARDNVLLQVDRSAPELERFLREFDGRSVTLFLDYDGTLAAFNRYPDEAVLAAFEHEFLRRMASFPNLTLIVVSGRDRDFMWRQLREYGISFAVEHGAQFYDARLHRWRSLVRHRSDVWYSRVLQILEDYCLRVPGSEIERKRHSVVWHYRRAPHEFGEIQARKLQHTLEHTLSSIPVQVLSGKKLLEVRAVEANKGAFVSWYLEHYPDSAGSRRMLAVGDDVTDEDMFAAVQSRKGVAVKVGLEKTVAHYSVASRREIFALVEALGRRISEAEPAAEQQPRA